MNNIDTPTAIASDTQKLKIDKKAKKIPRSVQRFLNHFIKCQPSVVNTRSVVDRKNLGPNLGHPSLHLFIHEIVGFQNTWFNLEKIESRKWNCNASITASNIPGSVKNTTARIVNIIRS